MAILITKPIDLTTRDRARFAGSIQQTSTCWLWTGPKNEHGYGVLWQGLGRYLLAHRVSWSVHRGPLPDGMCVLHHCDNPSCVNPAHLFLGSHADNNKDMTAKGRHGNTQGRRNGRARWHDAEVVEIRRLYHAGVSSYLLAKMFRTAAPVIYRIANGLTWKHLPFTPPTTPQKRPARPRKQFVRPLTPAEVTHIRQAVRAGQSYRSLAEALGMPYITVYHAATGNTYRYVKEPPVSAQSKAPRRRASS